MANVALGNVTATWKLRKTHHINAALVLSDLSEAWLLALTESVNHYGNHPQELSHGLRFGNCPRY
jgi:hypothetical protein